MSSTQPQIARSSEGATSLVFSVEGRVVECSTSRWRPEVFVAGIYPGCRVMLLSTISARVISISHCHVHALAFYATAEVGGRKYTPKFRSPKSLSLSGNYFRNRCKSAVAVAVAGSAACPPVCDRSCPSDKCGDRSSLVHRITVAIFFSIG